MKVCGIGYVWVYCFFVWLFYCFFNLIFQVQYDNELYFCDWWGCIFFG